jgi:hypothetical protein
MLLKRKALALTLIFALLLPELAGTFLIRNGTGVVAPDPLQRAVVNSIDFLKGSREPYALLMLDVMYRRFGIAEFADSLQRYDQVMTEYPEQGPMLRVFRRIADHDNPIQSEDLQNVSEDMDRVTIPALYCDRLGLPDNYPEMLGEAARTGGYLLTHALLALIWIHENGLEVPMSDSFVESIYLATAALISKDSLVNDLELEASAFLYLAGQGALVNDTFVERVIAAQNYDGGWLYSSNKPGESYWHSTVSGLLLLLHMEYPANSYPPMLSSESHESSAAPPITLPSLAFNTYISPNIPLVFMHNNPTSQISHSDEGQDSVTITGNTALRRLDNGSLQPTPSANYIEGKTGVSEIDIITLIGPFPALLIAVAAVSVVLVSVSLLLHFKKHES